MGILLVSAASAAGQEAGQSAGPGNLPPSTAAASVRFVIDRAGVETPHFSFSVRDDGSGHYEATTSPPTLSSRYTSAVAAPAEKVSQAIQLSRATTTKIFAGAHADDLFRMICNSKAKNIADTGRKSLSYEGPDGTGVCVYNYSENKSVTALTDLFLGMAYTIQEGRRLEFRHRYDRLGLDAEMGSLVAQADAGRAPELGLIAPVLQSLVADGDLLERVRERAAKLLERAQAER